MNQAIPEKLGIIAGRGAYPRLMAEGAKKQNVRLVIAVAFRGETDRVIEKVADDVVWLHVGQLEAMLEAFHQRGIVQAVMAGQIAPSNLFHLRLDARARAILEQAAGRPGHIFNLGHGIHKTSDPEKARTMLRFVHEHSRRIRSGS